jgi:beta-lactamase class A
MVAVGVARLVDTGRSDWALPLAYGPQTRPVGDWLHDMIIVSSNDATSALVAHLHARGAIRRDSRREGGREVHNELHDLFRAAGLPGLMLANTRPDGGWGNAAGSGVGQIQMTAWDALRLVWRLDADAPAAGPELVSPAGRAVIRRALDGQRLHHILSSESLRALSDWVPGIPAPAARFAHKTGNTQNYGSDAGIVHDGELHYLVAVTTSLGQRYAPHPDAATTWQLPALGAAVHAWLKANC